MHNMIYVPLDLLHAEDVEHYHPGGFHPIMINDVFDGGRFRVIHKLGKGGFSTVWLARDQQEDKLVALKAMRANLPSETLDEVPDLTVPTKLQDVLPPSVAILYPQHHFVVHGPNGTHLFLVCPLAGPTVCDMSYDEERLQGSRRLRADLARKVAQLAASAILHMHRLGVVHGGMSSLLPMWPATDEQMSCLRHNPKEYLLLPLRRGR